MAYYSQKSYPKVKLGTCKDTIAQSGCIITSMCNLLKRMDIVDIAPDVFNKLAIKNGWYSNGCLLDSVKVAKFYGLSYVKQIKPPVSVCMCETNYYSKVGVPQHFFLFNPANGKRLDPLDLEPSWETNNYPIVSYRMFLQAPKPIKKPAEIKTPEPVKKDEVVNIPIKVVEPTVPQNITSESIPVEPIKLSELPKIQEPTFLELIIQILKNIWR